ncbi:hypothetical protein swp_3876 [Shewanella piezotolerans WP3]|uniref:Uncharacterized protein n=1 Tax=Shewanella piezotolerans (strain WP3 / JCM 13877) TaxID=225849 RepID=B8CQT7_SHEPW|nr:hypothetical protein swp_3876 [Shewanella piezotolerans WP3]
MGWGKRTLLKPYPKTFEFEVKLSSQVQQTQIAYKQKAA